MRDQIEAIQKTHEEHNLDGRELLVLDCLVYLAYLNCGISQYIIITLNLLRCLDLKVLNLLWNIPEPHRHTVYI